MADGTVHGAFELTSEQALRGLRDIRDAGREADGALEALGRRMDDLGTKTARPRVDLTGIDAANAKLTELEARLDRISRGRYSPHVGVAGNVAGFPGGGGAGSTAGGGGLLSSIGGRAGLLPWWAAALPLVPQLAGGAGALVSSAGSAALGAGVVGLGGLASAGAGGLLTMAVAKPAISALGDLTKAQDAYTKAVQEFGVRSAQAATARRNFNEALVQNPMAAGAARQWAQFDQAWQSASAPARANVYRGVEGVLFNARAAMPTLGRAATTATGATATAATQFSSFLAAPAQQATLLRLTGSFARELPTAERSLENIATIFEHLAVDATPFFHEANVWVQGWTANMARQSADAPRVQSGMQRMVDSARDWARLTGAAGRDIRDLFAPGVPAGNSMVVSLTTTLDKWDVWLRANPEKTRQFFRDGEQGVSRIATVIANLTRDVWQIFRAVDPILQRAEQFISFASGIGGGSLLTGAGLLYGAYEGARGAAGRGPSPGGVVSSFVLGSSRGLGGGGTRAPGGGVFAAAPALGRASNYEAAVGRTAAGAFMLPGASVGPDAVLARRDAARAAAAADARAFSGLRSSVSSLVENSPLAARVADAAGTARELAMGAFSGVARFVTPLLALSGVLGALGAHGGVQARLGAGLSAATLGALPPATATSLVPGALGAAPGVAFSRAAPGVTARAAEALLGRVAGPQLLGAVGSRALSVLGGVGLGAAGAYAGYLLNPASTGASLSNPRTRASLQALGSAASAARSPQQLADIQAHVRIAGISLAAELPPDQQRKLQSYLQQILSTAAQNAGAAASNSWQTAFQTGLANPGHSPRWAVKMMLDGMQSQIKQLGPQGAKAFATNTALWVSQLEAENPKLQRPLEGLMGSITGDINRMNKATGDSFKALQDKVFYFNGQILSGSATTWKQIGKALTDPSQVAQEKLSGIWAQIQSEAVNALTGMGFSKGQARDIVTQTARGGPFAAASNTVVQTKVATGQTISQGAAFAPHARGGVIQGGGLLDTVALPDGSHAAPGEAWIANRHTMNALSSATLEKFGKTAWEIIRDESRPHSAPVRRHATGGFSTSTMAGSVTGVSGAPNHGWLATAYGPPWGGIEGGGTTATGVDLSRGQQAYIVAVDPSVIPLHSQVKVWPNPFGYTGTFSAEDTGGGIKGHHIDIYDWQGRAAQNAWGARDVSVQVLARAMQGVMAGGTGGGASAMQIPGLATPATGLGGIPGALAGAAGRMYAAGLTRRINAGLGAGMGGGVVPGGQGVVGDPSGKPVAGWIEPILQWARAHGWAGDVTSGWRSLAEQTAIYNSGVRPAAPPGSSNHEQTQYPGGAVDVTSAAQLSSVLSRSPYAQTLIWAGSKDPVHFSHPHNGGYQLGGRLADWGGWHALGADMTVNRPTVLGVGENGSERVRITRAGQRDAHTIQVIMENVNLSPADPGQVEAFAQDVAGRILDALDRTAGGASDASLAGIS